MHIFITPQHIPVAYAAGMCFGYEKYKGSENQ